MKTESTLQTELKSRQETEREFLEMGVAKVNDVLIAFIPEFQRRIFKEALKRIPAAEAAAKREEENARYELLLHRHRPVRKAGAKV